MKLLPPKIGIQGDDELCTVYSHPARPLLRAATRAMETRLRWSLTHESWPQWPSCALAVSNQMHFIDTDAMKEPLQCKYVMTQSLTTRLTSDLRAPAAPWPRCPGRWRRGRSSTGPWCRIGRSSSNMSCNSQMSVAQSFNFLSWQKSWEHFPFPSLLVKRSQLSLELYRVGSWELENRFFEPFFKRVVNWQLFFLRSRFF